MTDHNKNAAARDTDSLIQNFYCNAGAYGFPRCKEWCATPRCETTVTNIVRQGNSVNAQTGNVEFTASTPRTDAFHDKWDSYNYPHEAIHFARQLEWELAALNDKYLTVKLAWKLRGDELTRAEAALAAAQSKLAEFEQDAVRYRWLRSCDVECGVLSELARRGRCEELFDAAIDAARKGESQ